MKYKNLCTVLLLVVVTLVLSWTASALVHGVIFVTTCQTADDNKIAHAGAVDHRWHAVARWVFPLSLTLVDCGTKTLRPAFKVHFGWSLVISHLTFFGYLFFVGHKRARQNIPLRLVNACVIILFGLPGLIASLLFKET
ncbi:MAG: hypothetical protein LBG31_04510 [Prevotellaceae bacterium]|jgi:hypothetical protein|nr:hypothetical protein [Prevotellaceae bacterium]